MRNKLHKYILVDGKPEVCEDLFKWSEWFENVNNRKVLFTKITDEIAVSTIFLGMDHNFTGIGEPILWETMIFGGEHTNNMRRYTSLEAAKNGHQEIVNSLRNNTYDKS